MFEFEFVLVGPKHQGSRSRRRDPDVIGAVGVGRDGVDNEAWMAKLVTHEGDRVTDFELRGLDGLWLRVFEFDLIIVDPRPQY